MSDAHINAQLGLVVSRALQQAVRAQTTRTGQLNGQLVQYGDASGFVDLSGPGEATATISFPLVFAEKPVFTYGFEMGPSTWPVHGDFPIGTAVVMRWDQKMIGSTTTWVGAQVAIMLVGIAGPAVMHYDFKGKSLSLPSGLS
ncbi:chitinase [Caudovirales GX15bay]|nr:chitinase [Caudovirales GX15bay]